MWENHLARAWRCLKIRGQTWGEKTERKQLLVFFFFFLLFYFLTLREKEEPTNSRSLVEKFKLDPVSLPCLWGVKTKMQLLLFAEEGILGTPLSEVTATTSGWCVRAGV